MLAHKSSRRYTAKASENFARFSSEYLDEDTSQFSSTEQDALRRIKNNLQGWNEGERLHSWDKRFDAAKDSIEQFYDVAKDKEQAKSAINELTDAVFHKDSYNRKKQEANSTFKGKVDDVETFFDELTTRDTIISKNIERKERLSEIQSKATIKRNKPTISFGANNSVNRNLNVEMYNSAEPRIIAGKEKLRNTLENSVLPEDFSAQKAPIIAFEPDFSEAQKIITFPQKKDRRKGLNQFKTYARKQFQNNIENPPLSADTLDAITKKDPHSILLQRQAFYIANANAKSAQKDITKKLWQIIPNLTPSLRTDKINDKHGQLFYAKNLIEPENSEDVKKRNIFLKKQETALVDLTIQRIYHLAEQVKQFQPATKEQALWKEVQINTLNKRLLPFAETKIDPYRINPHTQQTSIKILGEEAPFIRPKRTKPDTSKPRGNTIPFERQKNLERIIYLEPKKPKKRTKWKQALSRAAAVIAIGYAGITGITKYSLEKVNAKWDEYSLRQEMHLKSQRENIAKEEDFTKRFAAITGKTNRSAYETIYDAQELETILAENQEEVAPAITSDFGSKYTKNYIQVAQDTVPRYSFSEEMEAMILETISLGYELHKNDNGEVYIHENGNPVFRDPSISLNISMPVNRTENEQTVDDSDTITISQNVTSQEDTHLKNTKISSISNGDSTENSLEKMKRVRQEMMNRMKERNKKNPPIAKNEPSKKPSTLSEWLGFEYQPKSKVYAQFAVARDVSVPTHLAKRNLNRLQVEILKEEMDKALEEYVGNAYRGVESKIFPESLVTAYIQNNHGFKDEFSLPTKASNMRQAFYWTKQHGDVMPSVEMFELYKEAVRFTVGTLERDFTNEGLSKEEIRDMFLPEGNASVERIAAIISFSGNNPEEYVLLEDLENRLRQKDSLYAFNEERISNEPTN